MLKNYLKRPMSDNLYQIRKMLYLFGLTLTLFAWFVTIIGAYTRLTDAGLGCPDWPICYKQITAPSTPAQIQRAQKAFPNAPVDTQKAWTEMFHRYIASALGLGILVLALLCFKYRTMPAIRLPRRLPWILVGIVIFQGLLGKWTVTLKLYPVVVMAHLLGGMSLLIGLTLFCQHCKPPAHTWLPTRGSCRAPSLWFGRLCLGALFAQIALGGWVSSQYAALVCLDFPWCEGKWLPPFSWKAFNLLEKDMSHLALVSIHQTHRLFAVLTAALLITFSIRVRQPLIAGLVCVQIALGVSNILFKLPLSVALAHNAIASLLLITCCISYYQLWIYKTSPAI